MEQMDVCLPLYSRAAPPSFTGREPEVPWKDETQRRRQERAGSICHVANGRGSQSVSNEALSRLSNCVIIMMELM